MSKPTKETVRVVRRAWHNDPAPRVNILLPYGWHRVPSGGANLAKPGDMYLTSGDMNRNLRWEAVWNHFGCWPDSGFAPAEGKPIRAGYIVIRRNRRK